MQSDQPISSQSQSRGQSLVRLSDGSFVSLHQLPGGDSQAASAKIQCSLGGEPSREFEHFSQLEMSETFQVHAWPNDKQSKQMIFLGKLYLRNVLAEAVSAELLYIFVSQFADALPLKERKVFHCFKTVAPVRFEPTTPPVVLNEFVYIPASENADGEERKLEKRSALISAFAANGVNYDERRAQDSCYEHLVEGAKNWRLLWRIANPGWHLNFKFFDVMHREADSINGIPGDIFLVRY